jgi:hypothetical protein
MSWKLRRSPDGSTVVIIFCGNVRAAEGAISASALADELMRAPAHLVWDVMRLEGYESAARIAWGRALSRVRHAIHGIEVVGGSPMVRVGLVTLVMMLKVEASFVDRWSDVRGARAPSLTWHAA